MADRFEDDRGVILDLLGHVDAVTEITTKAGAVRGNHVHAETDQWVYVVSGTMRFVSIQDGARREGVRGQGAVILEGAGVPHAWKAETDSTVLVLTRGPRSGSAYESDTIRLEVPLLT